MPYKTARIWSILVCCCATKWSFWKDCQHNLGTVGKGGKLGMNDEVEHSSWCKDETHSTYLSFNFFNSGKSTSRAASPARHDLGSAWHEPARGSLSATWAAGLSQSRNFISGPHWYEPAWAGPRAERSFPLFFTLKLSKIQHKTWVGPWTCGPGPGPGQIFKISSPALMDLGLARPAIYSSPRGSCLPLSMSNGVGFGWCSKK